MNFKIYSFPTLDSTSSALKKDCAHLEAGSIYQADYQSRGYGRNGRHFLSQGGLYFSILLEENTPFKVTAQAALCMAKALEKTTGLPIQIKWLNDLYYQNKKIAGILCESFQDDLKKKHLILGIGINIENPHFDSELKQKAGYLKQFTSKEISKEKIRTSFLEELNLFLENPEKPFQKDYEKRLLWKNENILILQGTKAYEARLLNISQEGELIVKKEGKEMALNSGEIHLFKKEKDFCQ